MIIKKTYTIFIILIGITTIKAQKTDFKVYHAEAIAFLKAENYAAALPILLEMEKMDDKNYNTLFNIGYCYLMTSYDKYKAIPYFERILTSYKNLTVEYIADNPKEKKAPIETIKFVGEAYHFNYQFDEAIEKFNEFKSILDPDNKVALTEIEKCIRMSNSGKRLVEKPIELKITPLDVLNTPYSEYRPKLNGDESILYFTSRRKELQDSAVTNENDLFENIYQSIQDEKGKWSTPTLLNKPINTPSHDACLYISPDNLYMIIYRADETTSTEGSIYESYFDGTVWSDLKLITAEVNSKSWETDVNISADGKTMLFTSNRTGGKGARDIWMMKKLPTGEWSQVQNLNTPVNTLYDEEAPYLHPDGKTLYFSSKGHNTMGGFDIFKSEMQADETWGYPENMGYPLNTTGDDVFFIPNLDGTKGYFSSYRKEGMGQQDLYELTFPKNEKRTLAIYKGKATYNTGEVIKNLQISIFKPNEKEKIGAYQPNNKTGRFLFILPPTDTFYVHYIIDKLTLFDTIIVPSKGGVFEIEKIVTVVNGQLVFVSEDKLKQETTINKVKVEVNKNSISNLNDSEGANNLNCGETEQLNNLLFAYNEATVIANSKTDVIKLINYMKNHPSVKIIIEGHTDSKGDYEYNLKLSQQRSEQIKMQLIAAGINKERMTIVGFGESKPTVANELPDGSDNPDGRQLNRRVEIKINK